jgi:hypothetical protein
MPEQCNKLMGQSTPGTPTASAEPPPPPPPPPSATTPPIYVPPDTTPTGPSTAGLAKAPDADTVAARAAFDKKQYKTVRTIVEKKIKSGNATTEDLALLAQACEKLKDKNCVATLKGAP